MFEEEQDTLSKIFGKLSVNTQNNTKKYPAHIINEARDINEKYEILSKNINNISITDILANLDNIYNKDSKLTLNEILIRSPQYKTIIENIKELTKRTSDLCTKIDEYDKQ